MTSEPQLITVLLGLIGGLIGGLFSHTLTARRDRAKHVRSLKTTYFIDAFRRLANASNRPSPLDPRYKLDIESAISDIMLLGSKEQIKVAKEFSEEIGEKGSACLNDLLRQLCNDLRKELGEKIIDENFVWLRMERSPVDTDKKDTST
ncbi:hypothetical protein EPN18_02630 [bacterium]|nr:MAG: hypothetical protein EPN18_02630 [bacterium]